VSWKEQVIQGFPTDKIRALLAYLCLEHDKVHRREILASLLWSNREDKGAKHNLRQSIYRIKRTLNKFQDKLGDNLFLSTRQTLQVQRKHIEMDVLTFAEGLKDFNEATTDTFFSKEKVREFEALAGLYRGPLLKGFDFVDEPFFDEWLLAKRATLGTKATALFERLARHHMEAGAYSDADKWLLQWLSFEPWNESAHRLRMQLLALDGQRSAALAQYHTLVDILLEHFQADPADETTDLYEQIHLEEVSEQQPSHQQILHHFPAQVTPFIGRDDSLQAIQELLLKEEVRLLTVLGTGGMGKTRSLIECSKRLSLSKHPFADGIFFVPLNMISSVSLFPSVVAKALGLSLQSSSQPKKQLLSYLQPRNLLLVLDNFEHLVEAGAFLQQVLEAAPQVKMLLSSRCALNIRSEHRYVLDGMRIEDATALFTQHAKRVQGDFDGSELQGVIRQICETVGGLPLAIELAASWIRAIECPEILEEIHHDLEFLQSDWVDLPERQKSMNAIFEHTWSMLSPKEQEALALVSLFQGTFSFQNTRKIMSISSRILLGLVDKTLLKRKRDGRYVLHMLLKQFVVQKRVGLIDETSVLQQYFEYYLDMVRKHERHFMGTSLSRTMEQFFLEQADILKAWELAVEAEALDLLLAAAPGLSYFLRHSGLVSIGKELFARAADVVQRSSQGYEEAQQLPFLLYQLECAFEYSDMQETQLLLERIKTFQKGLQVDRKLFVRMEEVEARLLLREGKYPGSITLFEDVLAYYQEQKDPAGCSRIWTRLGHIYFMKGEYERLLELLSMALEHDRKAGFQSGVSQKLNLLGMGYRELGDLQQAKTCLEESLSTAVKHKLRIDEARTTANLGSLYRALQDFNEALKYHQKSYQLGVDLGLRAFRTSSLVNMGIIFIQTGRFQEAEDVLLRGLQGREEVQDTGKIGVIQGNLGALYMMMGQNKQAEKYLKMAFQSETQAGHLIKAVRYTGILGELYAQQDLFEQAEACFTESLEILRSKNREAQYCWILVEWVELLYRQGRLERAWKANEEAFASTVKLQRNDLMHRCIGMKARLLSLQGRKQDAIALLDEHLGNAALSFEERTALLESIFWVRGEEEDVQKARSSLQELCQKIPSVRNRKRLAELEQHLLQHNG